MPVKIVPVLSDNYAYICYDESTKQGFVVDPVEPSKIHEILMKEHISIQHILTTHHHSDHDGGNKEMQKMFDGSLTIIGGSDKVAGVTKIVHHNDVFHIGNMEICAMSTPCHTLDSICYYVKMKEGQVVFTGDTLFTAGCGKFFEGNAKQMYQAIHEILGGLPEQTLIYPGHEYTTSNLKFAKSVEPHNIDIQTKLKWAMERRENSQPTVPSTLAEERKYNPFFRLKFEDVDAVGDDSVSRMQKMRDLKNSFTAV